MAGLTVTIQEKPVAMGHRYRTVNIVAADNSYTTGGYSLKATDLGLSAASVGGDLLVEVFNTYGYGWRYDYTTQKLLFYTTAGTQTTALTDLSALTDIRVVAYSKHKS